MGEHSEKYFWERYPDVESVIWLIDSIDMEIVVWLGLHAQHMLQLCSIMTGRKANWMFCGPFNFRSILSCRLSIENF